MKVEKGYMVIKEGKAWGVVYSGGHGHSNIYGWVPLEDAPIHTRISKPEYLTYKGSPYINELKTGKIFKVTRTTEVTIDGQ